MKLFIDADSFPYRDSIYAICNKFDLECISVCDNTRKFPKKATSLRRGGRVYCYKYQSIIVPRAKHAADNKIYEMATSGDIILTNDTRLATKCRCDKNAFVLNMAGHLYSRSRKLNRLYDKKYQRFKAPLDSFESVLQETIVYAMGQPEINTLESQYRAKKLDSVLKRRFHNHL